jgi:hypothetical protein
MVNCASLLYYFLLYVIPQLDWEIQCFLMSEIENWQGFDEKLMIQDLTLFLFFLWFLYNFNFRVIKFDQGDTLYPRVIILDPQFCNARNGGI